MIISKVLEAAQPFLEGRTVKDLVVGLSLIAVELDNGNVGLSYMSRERLPSGCSVFSFAQDVIGESANRIAKLTINGIDDAQRGVGMAVLSAASHSQNLEDVENHLTFGVELLASDTVGMIGYIPPIANMISKKAKKLIIFDKGIAKNGNEVIDIYPVEEQSKILPKCNVVFITGTTIINGTIDELLEICSNAREIILVGASTPMFPEAFMGTNVTILAGSWWDNNIKEELFKIISLAGGIMHVKKAMIKKAVSVNK